jgi:hypothetical protein
VHVPGNVATGVFPFVAVIVPVPLVVSEQPVPQTIAAVVFVPLVIDVNEGLPPPLFERRGASAESSAEISIVLLTQVLGVFVLQLIALVNVKDCGPVPAGGAIPGVILMVNFHVVFDGLMTPLSARRIAKLPGAPVPGDVGQPSPTGEVCVVKPPPFSVALAPPAVMSCAEIDPQLHTMPSTAPVIVPVTVVKPPWAKTERGQSSTNAK